MIAGIHDFICPPSSAYEMRAAMPNTSLWELRESGHLGHIEQAAEFASSVPDFIHNTETGKRK
ncbi:MULTISPECIES: alpha/beta hydrolase [unclassified Streptomyces]|uniref:alpha/beta fold hydrolase n=1 Tax=unclassified Streptomyces TaxID=2593676 RepID=UPI00081EE92A|nr:MULTISPECIES: alpha/beta hydrolase [unclassified Streptomyces]MYZ35513.1 hypothetical protein [Streptomyces sp. SID4917]SCF76111.1 hypothetical protein GA0115259_102167 [Streptomyces sp. MnatMP-M17]